MFLLLSNPYHFLHQNVFEMTSNTCFHHWSSFRAVPSQLSIQSHDSDLIKLSHDFLCASLSTPWKLRKQHKICSMYYWELDSLLMTGWSQLFPTTISLLHTTNYNLLPLTCLNSLWSFTACEVIHCCMKGNVWLGKSAWSQWSPLQAPFPCLPYIVCLLQIHVDWLLLCTSPWPLVWEQPIAGLVILVCGRQCIH